VLRADGGASANAFLMQFQADVAGCPVEVAVEPETTALGAALLAGLGAGIWPEEAAVAPRIRRGAVYDPSLAEDEREQRRAEWRAALARALVRPTI
jgi:glycerol kinase